MLSTDKLYSEKDIAWIVGFVAGDLIGGRQARARLPEISGLLHHAIVSQVGIEGDPDPNPYEEKVPYA